MSSTSPRTAPPERFRPEAQPGKRDAFRGTWQRRGLIQIPSDGIPDEYAIRAPRRRQAPHKTSSHQEDAVSLAAETQPERVETGPSNDAPRPAVVGTFCECGCWMRDDAELCPNCVIPWCRAQEERGFWRHWEIANRTGGATRQMIAEAIRLSERLA